MIRVRLALFSLIITASLLMSTQIAIAGTGLFIHITNKSGHTITVKVTKQSCMAHMGRLNNIKIKHNQTYPSQYIEERCPFFTSSYTLHFSSVGNFGTNLVYESQSRPTIYPNTKCGGGHYEDYNCFGWDGKILDLSVNYIDQIHAYITIK